MKKALIGSLLLLGAIGLGACGVDHSQDDNTREPEAFSGKPVQNHRFDGGETDPYFKPGDQSGESRAEKAAHE